MAALDDETLPDYMWAEKDERPMASWAAKKLASWEKEGSKLKEKYPTREEFDAWIAEKSATAKAETIEAWIDDGDEGVMNIGRVLYEIFVSLCLVAALKNTTSKGGLPRPLAS